MSLRSVFQSIGKKIGGLGRTEAPTPLGGIGKALSGLWSRMTGGGKSAPAAPTPETTPILSPDEASAKVDIDALIAMMEAGERFEHTWTRGERAGMHDAGGSAITQRNARDLNSALHEGLLKHSYSEILQSIQKAFGDIDAITLKVEQLIYAAFNSPKREPSGYAKWKGGGTFKVDYDKMLRALRGEYL